MRNITNKLYSEWLVPKSKVRRYELLTDIGLHQEQQGIPDKAIAESFHQLAQEPSVCLEYLTPRQLSFLASESGSLSLVPPSEQAENESPGKESGARSDRVLSIRSMEDDEESIEIALSEDSNTYETNSDENEDARKPERVKPNERNLNCSLESPSQNTIHRLKNAVKNEESILGNTVQNVERNKLENVLQSKECKQTSFLEFELGHRLVSGSDIQDKEQVFKQGNVLGNEGINQSDFFKKEDKNYSIISVDKGARQVAISETDEARVVETVHSNVNDLLNTDNSRKENIVKTNETEIEAQSDSEVPLQELRNHIFKVKENTTNSCLLQTDELTKKCNVVKNVEIFRNDVCELSKEISFTEIGGCENYKALQDKKTNDDVTVEPFKSNLLVVEKNNLAHGSRLQISKLQDQIAKRLKTRNIIVPFKLEDDKCKSTVKSNLNNVGSNASKNLFINTDIEKDQNSRDTNVLDKALIQPSVLNSGNNEQSLPAFTTRKSLDILINTDLNPHSKYVEVRGKFPPEKPRLSEHDVEKYPASEDIAKFEDKYTIKHVKDMECDVSKVNKNWFVKNVSCTTWPLNTVTRQQQEQVRRPISNKTNQDLMSKSKLEENFKRFSSQVKSLDEHLTAKKRALDTAQVEISSSVKKTRASDQLNKTLQTLEQPEIPQTVSHSLEAELPLLGSATNPCKNQSGTNKEKNQLYFNSLKELKSNKSLKQSISASKSKKYSADVLANLKNLPQKNVEIDQSVVSSRHATNPKQSNSVSGCNTGEVKAVTDCLSDKTVTSSTSEEYGAQNTVYETLQVNQSNILKSIVLAEMPALLSAVQSRAVDVGGRGQTVRMSACLQPVERVLIDKAVSLFLCYFQTPGNEQNCIPELFRLSIFQFIEKRHAILKINNKDTMWVYLTLYAFFYNESVNQKINKAAEILHLAIADFSRKIERLNRASRLTSKMLREDEKKEAESDYQGMLQIRGTTFKQYFEPLMLQFTECEYPMLVAWYFRITLALMRIDKENISHIYTIRSLIARLLKTSKYQFSPACNSYFKQPSDTFIETYMFIKNSLVALCLTEIDQPGTQDIIEFINLHPFPDQLKKMVCDIATAREERRTKVLTQSGANRAIPLEQQRTSSQFTSMLQHVAALQEDRLLGITTNSASSGLVSVGTGAPQNPQTTSRMRTIPPSQELRENQTFSHQQNTQAQNRPQATVNAPLLQQMIQKPPQQERQMQPMCELQLTRRNAVNNTAQKQIQNPSLQRVSGQQCRPVRGTTTHPVDSCTSSPSGVGVCCNTGCSEPSTVLCSICKTASYCSKQCQTNDWYQKHSTVCLGAV